MQKDDPRNIFFNQRQQYADGAKRDENQPETTQQQSKTASQQPSKSDYEQKVEEMKRLAEKYQREGEGQLVKDIVNSVIEQKASGNLTNEQLLAFAKRISPLLNSEQRTRLNGLVEQLLKL
ncbi:MAG: hypothetical protein ACI4QH_02845 [Candidatus Fimimonas sp.]